MADTRFVIYSHGFGVRKDDRGLMTDIAAALPGYKHVMFDYNKFDEPSNSLTVTPLSDQVTMFRDQLAALESNPDAVIDIVAHSQGCMVAALAQPTNVNRMIFITPPDMLDQDRLIEVFGDRPGSTVDVEGESRFSRRDGSITVVPSSYWKSLEGQNPITAYNSLSNHSDVTFITAKNDEVLGVSNFDQVDNRIKQISLEGNHDFNGQYREGLLGVIKRELS